MIPLLPFIAGLAAGAAAVSALRSERARGALSETGTCLRTAANKAEDGVRAAAQSGLALLRRVPDEESAVAPLDEPTAEPPVKPAAASAAAKRAAKKPATKPAANSAADAAVPQRAPRKPRTPKVVTPKAET